VKLFTYTQKAEIKVATQDESIQRGKKPVLAVLVILLCIIGISAVTYPISMGLVDNDSAIIPSDKVNAEFVDEGGNLMVTGGFSKAANNGEGASRISYTTSSEDGDDEKTRYNVKIQSLELGRANLNIKTDESLGINYVRIWFDITWKTVDPVEEYGMTVRLGIVGTDVSLSENEVSQIVEVEDINRYTFVLTGEIPNVVSSPIKPDLIVFDITIHVESF